MSWVCQSWYRRLAVQSQFNLFSAYCPNLSSGAAIGIIVALSIVCGTQNSQDFDSTQFPTVILFAVIVFALLRCRRTRQSQKQLIIEQEREERMRQHRTTYSSFPSVPIVTLSPIHAHHHNYVHVAWQRVEQSQWLLFITWGHMMMKLLLIHWHSYRQKFYQVCLSSVINVVILQPTFATVISVRTWIHQESFLP